MSAFPHYGTRSRLPAAQSFVSPTRLSSSPALIRPKYHPTGARTSAAAGRSGRLLLDGRTRLFTRGLECEKQGDLDGALECFSCAAAVASEDGFSSALVKPSVLGGYGAGDAWFKFGCVLFRKEGGRTALEVHAYEQAIALGAAQLKHAHCNLASANLELHCDAEAAIRGYAAALALDPGFAPAHLNLGRVYGAVLGRWELAIYHVRKAADAGSAAARELLPQFEERARVSALLFTREPAAQLPAAEGTGFGT